MDTISTYGVAKGQLIELLLPTRSTLYGQVR